MTHKMISRRRTLTIIAASMAMPLAARGGEKYYSWRGSVMGARAELKFYGSSREKAQQVTEKCLAEIDRLENIFSLFRNRSAISRLNRAQMLEAAPQDLQVCLSLAGKIGRVTGGAFDPTVQSLWQANANWYGSKNHQGRLTREILQRASERVDFRAINISDGKIMLGPGQSITLNGIAQGYITDRVCEMLRRHGWRNVLVNLGEFRALDGNGDGSAFQVLLKGSPKRVDLANAALASSSTDGFRFDRQDLGFGHIFDPKTGLSPTRWKSVHVRAASAAVADGLSTAFYVMDEAAIRQAIEVFGGTDVWLQQAGSRVRHLVT